MTPSAVGRGSLEFCPPPQAPRNPGTSTGTHCHTAHRDTASGSPRDGVSSWRLGRRRQRTHTHAETRGIKCTPMTSVCAASCGSTARSASHHLQPVSGTRRTSPDGQQSSQAAAHSTPGSSTSRRAFSLFDAELVLSAARGHCTAAARQVRGPPGRVRVVARVRVLAVRGRAVALRPGTQTCARGHAAGGNTARVSYFIARVWDTMKQYGCSAVTLWPWRADGRGVHRACALQHADGAASRGECQVNQSFKRR